jgi:hypothetical protein
MTSRPALHIVPDEPVDINAGLRANIMAVDWGAMHIAADRRAPVKLGEQRRRGWRG